MSDKRLFARPASGLVRSVSAWDAMIYNIVFMAPTAIFAYGFFALSLFPGVDLPTTALISVPLAIVVGLFFRSTRPRCHGRVGITFGLAGSFILLWAS